MRSMTIGILLATLCLPIISAAQSTQPIFDPLDAMLKGQQIWNNMDRARQDAPPSPTPQPYRPSYSPQYYQPQPRVDLNEKAFELLMQQYLLQQQLEHNHRQPGTR